MNSMITMKKGKKVLKPHVTVSISIYLSFIVKSHLVWGAVGEVTFGRNQCCGYSVVHINVKAHYVIKMLSYVCLDGLHDSVLQN